MPFKASVRLNDKPLLRLLRELKGKRGAINTMLKKWGIVYLAEQRRRYRQFSRGQGDWEPLSEEYAERKGSDIILILTSALFNAFAPGAPGNVFKRSRTGIVVGIVGEGNHPSGDFTIAALAQAHHEGIGNLPERPIIAPPTRKTVRRFLVIAQKQVQAAARGR